MSTRANQANTGGARTARACQTAPAFGWRLSAVSREMARLAERRSRSRPTAPRRSRPAPRRPPSARRRPSAPRGWRAGRRRSCRTPSAARAGGAGPTPGTPSSSERRSRIRRACRWNVTANRCASSRICCSRSRALLDARKRERLLPVAGEDQFLLLGQADRHQVGQAELLERLVGRADSCPLPPSIRIRSGNGPPCSSTRW